VIRCELSARVARERSVRLSSMHGALLEKQIESLIQSNKDLKPEDKVSADQWCQESLKTSEITTGVWAASVTCPHGHSLTLGCPHEHVARHLAALVNMSLIS